MSTYVGLLTNITAFIKEKNSKKAGCFAGFCYYCLATTRALLICIAMFSLKVKQQNRFVNNCVMYMCRKDIQLVAMYVDTKYKELTVQRFLIANS